MGDVRRTSQYDSMGYLRRTSQYESMGESDAH